MPQICVKLKSLSTKWTFGSTINAKSWHKYAKKSSIVKQKTNEKEYQKLCEEINIKSLPENFNFLSM